MNKWKNKEGFFENGRKLRILCVYPNKGGCAYYRNLLPIEKLQELYPNVVETRFSDNPLDVDLKTGQRIEDFDFEDYKWADVVVTNNISNYGGPFTARICGIAKEHDCLFHYDTDDLLTNLYEGHRLENTYKEKGLSEITKFIYNKADLVTVTQRKFAERIKEFIGGTLAVVKNSIDYNLPAWNKPKTAPRKKKLTRIGWVGGIHHTEDLKEFAGIPHLVNGKTGRENVHWGFYGRPQQAKGQPKDWQQETWDDYQNLLLKGFKGARNWDVFQALPTHLYGMMYANIDVSIAPLQNNPFNDSKSEIKVAECGRYKIPLVASNVGCYDETIQNGVTGYLIDPDAPKTEWVRRLAYLCKNPQKRIEMGEALHELTEKYFNINNVVHNRLDLYEQVFQIMKERENAEDTTDN